MGIFGPPNDTSFVRVISMCVLNEGDLIAQSKDMTIIYPLFAMHDFQHVHAIGWMADFG